jgi:hypothetical protein
MKYRLGCDVCNWLFEGDLELRQVKDCTLVQGKEFRKGVFYAVDCRITGVFFILIVWTPLIPLHGGT